MATGRIPTTANSPLTAKGDLFTFSTGSAKLAVGNNGETLVADSSATTGLRYQATNAAGKNAIINGGMDIWQRGTTITGGASPVYTSDRFSLYQNTAATVTRQVTNDTTNLPSIQYCLRAQRNNASTSTSGVSIAQSIESANSIPFAGKSVVYSFYARKGANFSGASNNISVYLVSGTGTDQNIHSTYTGASYIVSSTATLTTTWQRFTFTASVAGTATELAAYQEYTPVGTAGAADYFEITGVQLELGSVATTFSRAGGTIQGELAACQRYYWRATSATAGSRLGNFAGSGTTSPGGIIQNPVLLRTAATSLEYADIGLTTGGGATYTVTAATLSGATHPFSTQITLTTTASTTAEAAAWIRFTNATGYVGVSAEL